MDGLKQEKKCNKCLETKPASLFYIRSRNGREFPDYICKDCTGKQNKDYYHKNRAARLSWQKKYAATSKGKSALKRASLKFHYGITLDEYELLIQKQCGRCDICGTDEPGGRFNDRLFVDHDHSTGEIRALLCHNCNAGIGHMREDVEILEKAISYLNKHKKPSGLPGAD